MADKLDKLLRKKITYILKENRYQNRALFENLDLKNELLYIISKIQQDSQFITYNEKTITSTISNYLRKSIKEKKYYFNPKKKINNNYDNLLNTIYNDNYIDISQNIINLHKKKIKPNNNNIENPKSQKTKNPKWGNKIRYKWIY